MGRPEVTDEARQPPHGRPQRHDEDDQQCPCCPGQQGHDLGGRQDWILEGEDRQLPALAGGRGQQARQGSPQEAGGALAGVTNVSGEDKNQEDDIFISIKFQNVIFLEERKKQKCSWSV